MTPAFALPGLAPDLLAFSDAQSPAWDALKRTIENGAASAANPALGALAQMRSVGSNASGALSGWIGARGVTLLLGFLLIAAAIFSHPVVVETAKSAGRTAGKIAAVAA